MMNLLATTYAESGKTDLESSKNVKNGEPPLLSTTALFKV